MYRIFVLIFGVILLGGFMFLSKVEARSGCCSHHGGVCGCGCCDGTGLSATCSPYYPECNKPVCKPSCGCASKTCSGKTCSNGCGGSCKGTKNCTPAPAPAPTPEPDPVPVTAPATQPTTEPLTAPSTTERNDSNKDQQDTNKDDKGETKGTSTTKKPDSSTTACSSVFVIGGIGIVAKIRKKLYRSKP